MKTIAMTLALLVPSSLAAQTVPDSTSLTPAEAIQHIQRANQALSSWSADFEETRLYVYFDVSETRTGTLVFKRGSGARLDIVTPDQETIVVTDGRAQQWRPKTRQIHVFRFTMDGRGGKARALPLPIPVGDSDWDPSADHSLSLLAGAADEVVLAMVPAAASSTYQKKTIWFDRQSWLPRKIELVESTDDIVRYSFSAVVVDGPVDDDRFVLDVGPDAEVVEHTDLPEF